MLVVRNARDKRMLIMFKHMMGACLRLAHGLIAAEYFFGGDTFHKFFYDV